MPNVPNFTQTLDVVASLTDDAETVVGLLYPVTVALVNETIKLHGHVNVTVDATTTALEIGIRRDSISGSLIGLPQQVGQTAAFGAGSIVACDIDVEDTPGALSGGTYVLTAAATGATGPSTVNAVTLVARVD